MPIVEFDALPDSARVWVYGADRELGTEGEQKMLGAVDEFLSTWSAHGAPLSTARRWDDGRFLTIAVDTRQEGASGCSIDGLYRALKSLEPSVGAHLVTSGLVYFRDRDGRIQAMTRDEFGESAARGEVDSDTEVFDLAVTSLGEWRGRFKARAGDSWHGSLISARVTA
ncbi:MAG: hypothetical protein ABI681_13120 [Gemmatimonadales bacterium]